jgi:anti-sigma factor RsiW
MKCQDVSKELVAYLDRRANSAERQDVEEHLVACAECRTRAEEFRRLWAALDEEPMIESSLGFNTRVRQRVAAEPRPRWFRWLVPQPRLAISMALLLALSVWMARQPQDKSGSFASAPTEDEQFQMIQHLGVLENFDVLSKSDALSELPPIAVEQLEQPQQDQQGLDDSGGM